MLQLGSACFSRISVAAGAVVRFLQLLAVGGPAELVFNLLEKTHFEQEWLLGCLIEKWAECGVRNISLSEAGCARTHLLFIGTRSSWW